MKRIIRASNAVESKIFDFLHSKANDGSPLDTNVKNLIKKYSDDKLADSRDWRQLIRKNGADLINYISERMDVPDAMIPSILKYYAMLPHAVAAATAPGGYLKDPEGYAACEMFNTGHMETIDIFDTMYDAREAAESALSSSNVDYTFVEGFSNGKRYWTSKEVAAASEVKLETTRFTTPSIRTDDQRNVLEALELAWTQKWSQWDKFCEINIWLTSDESWTGKVTEYSEGYYIQLTGTRSVFQAFVQGDTVVRKPRNITPIATYDVDGTGTRVDWMGRRKEVKKY